MSFQYSRTILGTIEGEKSYSMNTKNLREFNIRRNGRKKTMYNRLHIYVYRLFSGYFLQDIPWSLMEHEDQVVMLLRYWCCLKAKKFIQNDEVFLKNPHLFRASLARPTVSFKTKIED